MNHLPSAADHSRPKVGFYAKQRRFSPDSFFRIPAEYNYDNLELLVENGLDPSMDGRKANTFLQEWLWFSFLARITHQTIDSADFINGNQGLSTKKLNSVLKSWIDDEGQYYKQNHSCPYPEARYLKATMALVYTRRFVLKHLSFEPRDTDTYPRIRDETDLSDKLGLENANKVSTELTLSIAALGQILQRERRNFRREDDDVHESWKKREVGINQWGYSMYCRQAMKGKWCPSQIRRMESTLPGPCEVYYASSFDPPDPYGHEMCDIWNCKKPHGKAPDALHMSGCDGNCGSSLTIDDQDRSVSEIIEAGKTPLVTYDGNKLELRQVDLQSEDLDFGCLSHSWSDALLDVGRDSREGNNRTMLRCQLEKMQENFNVIIKKGYGTLGPNVPFWVDTLCFPRQEDMKARAINQLGTIYGKAAAAVVWDKSLIASSAYLKPIDINMQVRFGDWSQRLWTLLEAVLCKEVHFAFKNHLMSLEEIVATKNEAKDLFHEYHHVWQAGHPFTEAIWELKKWHHKGIQEGSSRVLQTWAAIQFHLLDEPQDEALIISALLGLDARPIEQVVVGNEEKHIVAAKRMVRLLDEINKHPDLGIPSGIIFFPQPSLMMEDLPETHGYKWAPQTWLSKQTHPYPLYEALHQAANIGQHGLLVWFSGIRLHCRGACPAQKKFWVPVNQLMHEWLKIDVQKDENWESFWENDVRGGIDGNHAMIIMSQPKMQDTWDIGLLVKKKGELRNGQVLWVESLCRVRVRLETNPNTIQERLKSFREESKHVIFGTHIARQEWCIDGGSVNT